VSAVLAVEGLDAVALSGRRPRHHEVELHTPHYVEPGEIESAERELLNRHDREQAAELDSPEWTLAVHVIAGIEGWLLIAREYGTTRRSLVRSIEHDVACVGGDV
jgi:hypothetical protein